MTMNSGAPDDGDAALIASINPTPLVDVMLVLLIIFLITIPVVTSSIPVALPKQRLQARQNQPDNVIISVDKNGAIYFHDTRMKSVDALLGKLKQVVRERPQVEVQVRGDMAASYEGVGQVLLACQRAGIGKVAFITEPPPLGG